MSMVATEVPVDRNMQHPDESWSLPVARVRAIRSNAEGIRSRKPGVYG